MYGEAVASEGTSTIFKYVSVIYWTGAETYCFFKNLVRHIMIWLYDVTCGFFFLGWGPEM